MDQTQRLSRGGNLFCQEVLFTEAAARQMSIPIALLSLRMCLILEFNLFQWRRFDGEQRELGVREVPMKTMEGRRTEAASTLTEWDPPSLMRKLPRSAALL